MTDTSLVARFYDRNASAEHRRLIDNPLEYSITLKAILDTIALLPSEKPLKIADIGGGTGRYAVELSKLGHKVTLSDISSSELELATEYAMKENVSLDRILQADARQLSSVFLMKGEYDIVLLLGPLYHLLQETERLDVIDSCIAITKPKGYIICSFVTKFAHLRDLVQKDPGRLLREKKFYDEYSLTGRYIRNGGIQSHHTHLAEIQQLFNKIGNSSLAVRKLVACEGFLGGGLTKHLAGLGEDEYRAWVDITLATAEDPHVLSASDHIAVVAERC